MTRATVRLGYEIGSGDDVDIPVGHMVVSGITQLSGKTTTLEALISRAGRRAIAFVTKRGERAFEDGRRVSPFFRERADWQFVASLIDATMNEKNKFLRAWLMKVCRGTQTLADVQRNVIAAKDKARGFAESIYTEIEGYLELVVPQLEQLPPARGVEIGPGLNVMDLSPYSTELQGLVIRSVIEHVYEHENEVITVIPEAWEFLPEGRGSPVKLAAERLIRKGAALENFVWLDSQDLAGVWKLALRAASVYLIGVQREANEIKRTLSNIPAGVAKPKAGDIARLERGQFYACHGRDVVRTFVQAAWIDNVTARATARGAPMDEAVDQRPTRRVAPTRSELASRPLARSPFHVDPVRDDDVASLARPRQRTFKAPPPAATKPEEDSPMSAAAEQKLDDLLALIRDFVHRGAAAQTAAAAAGAGVAPSAGTGAPIDEEALYQRFKARLVKEAPSILQVLTVKSGIELEETIETIKIDGRTALGWVAKLIVDGFFDGAGKNGSQATEEINRRGGAIARPTVYAACDEALELGYLHKEKAANRTVSYVAVQDMKKHVVRK